ncbi:MAG: cbb3-type cytochrome c oxidase N-terminal domain-containing protein, partial [Bacteroidota bacterium]
MKFPSKQKSFLTILALLATTPAMAQEAITVWDRVAGLSEMNTPAKILAFLLIAGLLYGLYSLYYLFNTLMHLQKVRLLEKYAPEVLEKVGIKALPPAESWWRRAYKKWTNVVPIDREADVMLDHNYDGIRELDNSLPPWWVALFYATIVIGVVYFGINHMTSWGKSSAEWYAIEMEKAEEEVKAFLATQANAVDETNVTLLADAEPLENGRLVFEAKCAVCHGQLGEGGIGPNLTDQYWLHGGDITSIFSTVKYGVPEKGMVAW